MIDFHSHFLPGIDDGSENIKESVEMLQESYRQGVETIVATPHFYAERDSVTRFLERREESYQQLMEALRGVENMPEIHIGAEVLFFRGMSQAKQLSSLCIDKGNVLLLEMPFCQWDGSTIAEVENVIKDRELYVVIAHLDRYYHFQKNQEYLKRLLELPVGIQLNASAFEKFRKGTVLRLVRDNRVDALGSDCHNMSSRRPNIQSAVSVIDKKLGREYVDRINLISNGLLQRGGM